MSKKFTHRQAAKDRFIIDNMHEGHIEAFLKNKLAILKMHLKLDDVCLKTGIECSMYEDGSFEFRIDAYSSKPNPTTTILSNTPANFDSHFSRLTELIKQTK
jgi:hypothetical protein